DLLRGRAITTTLANLPGGVAEGVSPTGALLVQTTAGLREVTSGEVSVRLERGAPDTGSSATC
ncbi:MAG TPA: biotin--[acetyl-CoA-carboxylase] ligase, partial [Rhizobacter sp.]|nr:biotin--[acetyl-CoA-carboxylase] ligase [Rhizobacter sp.]